MPMDVRGDDREHNQALEEQPHPLALPRCSVGPHLDEEELDGFADRLHRVLVAPVAHPQVQPRGIKLSYLLLLLAGGVDA